jgi:hypothetical protein
MLFSEPSFDQFRYWASKKKSKSLCFEITRWERVLEEVVMSQFNLFLKIKSEI